ncbi:ACP S-malonyltransferase [Geobacter sulfurreducens]|uniref:[acyl-carrier-protein] S-malonyltransferase n=2 Tax=Geobacter sulfurreducens TaxID=35554 RepID=Q74GK6_GEOSL|nr:malonyl-CoA--acyl carrier protein transacylase [Geobacter sulfurreducens PCA]ADI83077.1 malonyl-CoA--acyl carrier protein transacylase [Geobacter sulfurreducens KN400]QVW35512.1 ACP S-malonyltransferase [Geobacter sulfurreducens]UAC04335.1 acyltransferase domain-containing protein [Geobacter sulfurreducens]HBB68797.1 ACP S-malonyltransferase [Geobacter sulfurreducens]
MICFMFPGQPLAPPVEFPEDADFEAIALLTRQRASFDLHTFSWTGEPSSDTVALQAYGVAMGLYRTRRLRAEGIAPRLIAEHSMGIYPALAAAGALDEGDALELAVRLGRTMAAMGRQRTYALGCMVGLTLEPLLVIAENNGVYLANHNTSRHFLLAGERGAMEDACAEALARGAFSARLFPCDAPLHTPLMAEVAEELAAVAGDYRYREPSVPLVDHIDQDFLAAADLPVFMVRDLMEPVRWERTYRALRAAGVDRLYEVGAGDSLRKYNRWIESERGR